MTNAIRAKRSNGPSVEGTTQTINSTSKHESDESCKKNVLVVDRWAAYAMNENCTERNDTKALSCECLREIILT